MYQCLISWPGKNKMKFKDFQAVYEPCLHTEHAGGLGACSPMKYFESRH